MSIRVRVWDLPTRLFHWALMLGVVGMVVSANMGQMERHVQLGQWVMALLLFRVVWALVGGHWSRLSSLDLSPKALLGYWRGQREGGPGHSPAGAWASVGLVLWLLLQVGTGLMADDEIATTGPLTALVPEAWVRLATFWHKGPGKLVLLVLVLLHVAALVWYRVKRGQALVPAMWHGDKVLAQAAPASRDDARSRLLALVLFGLCYAGVRWVFSLQPALM